MRSLASRLILYTGKPVEHDCSETSRNIVYAALYQDYCNTQGYNYSVQPEWQRHLASFGMDLWLGGISRTSHKYPSKQHTGQWRDATYAASTVTQKLRSTGPQEIQLSSLPFSRSRLLPCVQSDYRTASHVSFLHLPLPVQACVQQVSTVSYLPSQHPGVGLA